MVDSQMVLAGQTVAYTSYCIVIILLVGWFGYKLTRQGNSGGVKNGLFYAFVTFLVILGVSLHIVTYNTIPWASMDLNRAEIKPDKVFEIGMEKHQFKMPAEKLEIGLNEKVLFKVTSADLTYGFGVFRPDNSMVFQMQVIPGHMNDILWQFTRPGVYSIRSTEYSGPEGVNMFLKDVILVSDATPQQ